jgi:hypothetical protein
LWARLRRPHLPVRPCWKGVLLRILSKVEEKCKGWKGQGCALHTLSVAPWLLRAGQLGGGRVT